MNKKWHGLLEIIEITHKDKNGNILWEENNLTNILHNTGEKLLLSSVFAGVNLPGTYNFGLDSRTSLTVAGGTNGESLIYPYIVDFITLASAPDGEPGLGVGYSRVSVANNSFVISIDTDSHYKASGSIISFVGTGAGWGPVTNLFMSYVNGSNQDVIIATVPLTQPITVINEQVVNVRMALKLRTC